MTISPVWPWGRGAPVSWSTILSSVPGLGYLTGSGEGSASSLAPISQKVTATVDSVGP